MDWMWLTQWDISEEIIWENFKNAFREWWEEITSTHRNVELFAKWKKLAEFDIIWVNGTKVFVWETKTKLTEKHIDKFIDKTIPNFKKYLQKRRYPWMKLYWVIWTRIFDNKEVKKYAMKKWLYIIKEFHNWNAKMLKESLNSIKSF